MVDIEPKSPPAREFLCGVYACLRETADRIRSVASPTGRFTDAEGEKLLVAARLVEEANETFTEMIGNKRLGDLEQRRGKPTPPAYLDDSIGAKLSRIVEATAIIHGTATALHVYENELTEAEQQYVHQLEAVISQAFEIAQS